jgi:hypothetical protein
MATWAEIVGQQTATSTDSTDVDMAPVDQHGVPVQLTGGNSAPLRPRTANELTHLAPATATDQPQQQGQPSQPEGEPQQQAQPDGDLAGLDATGQPQNPPVDQARIFETNQAQEDPITAQPGGGGDLPQQDHVSETPGLDDSQLTQPAQPQQARPQPDGPRAPPQPAPQAATTPVGKRPLDTGTNDISPTSAHVDKRPVTGINAPSATMAGSASGQPLVTSH